MPASLLSLPPELHLQILCSLTTRHALHSLILTHPLLHTLFLTHSTHIQRSILHNRTLWPFAPLPPPTAAHLRARLSVLPTSILSSSTSERIAQELLSLDLYASTHPPPWYHVRPNAPVLPIARDSPIPLPRPSSPVLRAEDDDIGVPTGRKIRVYRKTVKRRWRTWLLNRVKVALAISTCPLCPCLCCMLWTHPEFKAWREGHERVRLERRVRIWRMEGEEGSVGGGGDGDGSARCNGMMMSGGGGERKWYYEGLVEKWVEGYSSEERVVVGKIWRRVLGEERPWWLDQFCKLRVGGEEQEWGWCTCDWCKLGRENVWDSDEEEEEEEG